MYQLAFVTSTTRDAQSRDIAAYNQHVQNAANNAGIGIGSTRFGFDVTWTAIASTRDVHARDNARVEGEVYNLNGRKVADSFGDMWDGSLDATLTFTEKGDLIFDDVWSGTDPSGETGPGRYLGLGFATVGTPVPGFNNPQRWIDAGQRFNLAKKHFYGLSQKLTVPAPVPAPTTTILFGTGLVALVAWRTRRQTADS